MAQFKIVWSNLAATQRKEVFEYWNNRNGNTKYSLKLLKTIQARMKLIAVYSKMGIRTNYRDIFVSHLGDYSIFYRVTDNEIHVALFWDNRQDPEKIAKLLS